MRRLIWLFLGTSTAWAGDFAAGVSDDRLSLPDGPGSLEGVGDNVSINPNMGVMQHSVAFTLPRGFPGATPSLGLSYSSGNGNGEVGVGWSLAVPSVERMTARGLPSYDSNGDDRMVADGGEQLVRVDLQNGVAVYRARFESGFVRWLWHDPGAGGYWEAQYPDGGKGFFGADRTGSAIPEARVEGRGGVFRYHLVESVDVHGHRVRYEYRKTAGGHSLLLRIAWLFFDDAAGRARYSVELAYQPRADILSDASSGAEVRLDERLAGVDVFYEGANGKERIRGYRLSYGADNWLSQLERVQQFGLGDPTNSSPYPIVHTFAYTQAIGSTTGQSLITVGGQLTGAAIALGKATLVDLDGDALPDVVDSSGAGNHSIWLSQLATNGAQQFTASSPSALANSLTFPINDPRVITLDANGDGFTDLLRSDTAQVLINEGKGDWSRLENLGSGLPDMTAVAAEVRFFDYDGDKRIDVLRSSSVSSTVVYRNLGNASFALDDTVDALGLAFAGQNVQMADMNGDGLLDVVQVVRAQIRYRLNLGRGKWSGLPGQWTVVDFPDVTDTDLPFVMLEDLNGDSLADLVIVRPNAVKYALNRNGALFAAIETITSAGGSSLPDRPASTTVIAADMNGNGSQDIVWIDSTGTVRYLELFAVRPNLLTRIENGIGHVTDISYASTVSHLARAREAGKPWKHRVPFPMTVVDKVDEWDRLTNLHDLVEYQYDDGYYDGTEKQYRGHERVEMRELGDATEEDGLTSSEFDVGAGDVYLNGQLLKQTLYSGGRLINEETHEIQKCPVELEASSQLPVTIWHACEVKTLTSIYEGTDTPVITEQDTEYDGYGNVIKSSNLGVVGQDGDEMYSETSYVPRDQTGGAWILHAPYRSIRYGKPGGLTAESLTYYDGNPFEGRLGSLTKGLPTRTTQRVSDSESIDSSRVSYDANGQVIETLDPNGSPADAANHRRRYHYDGDGLRPTQVDILVGGYQLQRRVRYDQRLGVPVWATDYMRVEGAAATGENASAFEHDSFGRMVAIHRPDPATGLPSAEPTKWFSYDVKSPSSRISSYSTLGGENVRCVDGRGRAYQSKTRTAAGNYLVTGFNVFNVRGETVESYQPYSSTTADCDAAPPAGTLATRFRYDAAHRLLETSLPDEAIYGSPSLARTVYLPLSTQELDANDTDPASPFASTPLVRRTDGLGRLTAIGRTMAADAPPSMLTITYDELGRMTGYIDSAGNTKVQSYDLAGRVIEVRDPNSGTTKLTYDLAGKVLSRTDARGTTVKMSYDGLNRLVERWEDGNREATLVGAIYDAEPGCPRCSNTAGRIAALFYPDGKDTIGYDVRGRSIYSSRALESFAFETVQLFDDRDRLASVTYPDGRTLARGYDDAGRLTTIDGVVIGITYDNSGLPTDTAYANNTHETRSYDQLRRLIDQTLSAPKGVAQSLRYTRDRVGNVLAVDDLDSRLDAAYSLDGWYRLTDAKLGDETLSYQYDPLDNLMSATSSQGSKSPAQVGEYTYDKSRPNAATKAGLLALEYDAAGYLEKRGDRKLTWDGFGRMSGVSLSDGDAIYKHGTGADRVLAIEPHAVTHYISRDFEVHDGLGVIYQRLGLARIARLVDTSLAAKLYPDALPDGKITSGDAWLSRSSDSPIERMLLSSARRILYESVPRTTWFGHDHLDSTTVETDESGGVIGRRSYLPFGGDRASAGDTDRYGFTGQETDGTGMLHFQFRHLDPVTGRWISPDPLFSVSGADNVTRLGESTAAYAYVGNSPINFVDPTGLNKEMMAQIRSLEKVAPKDRVKAAVKTRNGAPIAHTKQPGTFDAPLWKAMASCMGGCLGYTRDVVLPASAGGALKFAGDYAARNPKKVAVGLVVSVGGGSLLVGGSVAVSSLMAIGTAGLTTGVKKAGEGLSHAGAKYGSIADKNQAAAGVPQITEESEASSSSSSSSNSSGTAEPPTESKREELDDPVESEGDPVAHFLSQTVD